MGHAPATCAVTTNSRGPYAAWVIGIGTNPQHHTAVASLGTQRADSASVWPETCQNPNEIARVVFHIWNFGYHEMVSVWAWKTEFAKTKAKGDSDPMWS